MLMHPDAYDKLVRYYRTQREEAAVQIANWSLMFDTALQAELNLEGPDLDSYAEADVADIAARVPKPLHEEPPRWDVV